MGMGIVSDTDFEKERTNLNVPPSVNIPKPIDYTKPPPTENHTIEGEIVEPRPRGRGKNNLEVPHGLRAIIGEESAINGRQSALKLAESFGISASSTSAYNNGATSTSSYDTPNRELSSHITNAKERVSKRARTKLMMALHHITSDKLEAAKPGELAGVAKDMAAIIKTMEPDVAGPNVNKSAPQFIFYAPKIQKEDTFDVITVKE